MFGRKKKSEPQPQVSHYGFGPSTPDLDDNDEGEYISVYDAAEIWRDSGKDEDNMFGYTEDELERALNS